MISSTEAPSGASKWFAGHPAPVWYTISRHGNHCLEVLTISSETREETVPIFRDARSAEAFLLRGDFGPGWWTRESTAGEMISLLFTCLAEARHVALDPPAIFATANVVGLESTSKKEFIAVLMGRPLLAAR